jgi:hypothetical protein
VFLLVLIIRALSVGGASEEPSNAEGHDALILLLSSKRRELWKGRLKRSQITGTELFYVVFVGAVFNVGRSFRDVVIYVNLVVSR